MSSLWNLFNFTSTSEQKSHSNFPSISTQLINYQKNHQNNIKEDINNINELSYNISTVLNDPLNTYEPKEEALVIEPYPGLSDKEIGIIELQAYWNNLSKLYQYNPNNISTTIQAKDLNKQLNTTLNQIPNFFYQTNNFSLHDYFNSLQVDHLTDEIILQQQQQLQDLVNLTEQCLFNQIVYKRNSFLSASKTVFNLEHEVNDGLLAIKNLRQHMKQLYMKFIYSKLLILYLKRRNINNQKTLKYMKLIDMVVKAPKVIHSLLSSNDFTSALDIINTTTTILNNKLSGLTCLKFMKLRLNESKALIEKFMIEQFYSLIGLSNHRFLYHNLSSYQIEIKQLIYNFISLDKFSALISNFRLELTTYIKQLITDLVFDVLECLQPLEKNQKKNFLSSYQKKKTKTNHQKKKKKKKKKKIKQQQEEQEEEPEEEPEEEYSSSTSESTSTTSTTTNVSIYNQYISYKKKKKNVQKNTSASSSSESYYHHIQNNMNIEFNKLTASQFHYLIERLFKSLNDCLLHIYTICQLLLSSLHTIPIKIQTLYQQQDVSINIYKQQQMMTIHSMFISILEFIHNKIAKVINTRIKAHTTLKLNQFMALNKLVHQFITLSTKLINQLHIKDIKLTKLKFLLHKHGKLMLSYVHKHYINYIQLSLANETFKRIIIPLELQTLILNKLQLDINPFELDSLIFTFVDKKKNLFYDNDDHHFMAKKIYVDIAIDQIQLLPKAIQDDEQNLEQNFKQNLPLVVDFPLKKEPESSKKDPLALVDEPGCTKKTKKDPASKKVNIVHIFL